AEAGSARRVGQRPRRHAGELPDLGRRTTDGEQNGREQQSFHARSSPRQACRSALSRSNPQSGPPKKNVGGIKEEVSRRGDGWCTVRFWSRRWGPPRSALVLPVPSLALGRLRHRLLQPPLPSRRRLGLYQPREV